MYAYYRTSCHSTVIQKILRGSISSNGSADLVLVKVFVTREQLARICAYTLNVQGNSLEWMTVGSVSEADPNLLTRQLQQAAFGTINDAQILSCSFTDLEDEKAAIEDEVYEQTVYSKRIRNHSIIQGQDILVALSEYGKLVFMTIHSDQDLDVKRFETLTEVIYLDTESMNTSLIKNIRFIWIVLGWNTLKLAKNWQLIHSRF